MIDTCERININTSEVEQIASCKNGRKGASSVSDFCDSIYLFGG